MRTSRMKNVLRRHFLFLQNFRLYRVDGRVEFLHTAYEKEWGMRDPAEVSAGFFS